MNLCDFLHFNNGCPVCGNSLTLYAQVLNGTLWRAKYEQDGVYYFEQFKSADMEPGGENDFFQLVDRGETFHIDYGSPEVHQKSKTWSIFFYFMCNSAAIEDSYHDNYNINPYMSCYFCSSQFLEFKKNSDNIWALLPLDELNTTLGPVRDEIFTFKVVQDNGNEKVYILNLNNEDKITYLVHYNMSPEEKADKKFEPKIFKKELPALSVRPNFDIGQREQLISRLDSWILMS